LTHPIFPPTAVIVNGNVAADEDVENAVSKGVVIFLRCLKGLDLPINLTINGRVYERMN